MVLIEAITQTYNGIYAWTFTLMPNWYSLANIAQARYGPRWFVNVVCFISQIWQDMLYVQIRTHSEIYMQQWKALFFQIYKHLEFWRFQIKILSALFTGTISYCLPNTQHQLQLLLVLSIGTVHYYLPYLWGKCVIAGLIYKNVIACLFYRNDIACIIH